MFNIKLENGVTVMAHLSGKIRQNRIKVKNVGTFTQWLILILLCHPSFPPFSLTDCHG